MAYHTLLKELKMLELQSNKLCHRAYKTRFEVASKEWQKYRKVHLRLKQVRKQVAERLRSSQDVHWTDKKKPTYHLGEPRNVPQKPPKFPK